MTYSRRLSRPALPGRSAASLAHCVLQFVRRLTTKELVFLRFVAPRSARVNDKKPRDRREKSTPSPLHAGSQMGALLDLWICDFECGDQRREGGSVGQFQTVLTSR